jgi:DNA-binding XRE family transcriptional regulator
MTGPEYKALRERLNLTQGELASRLGVTRKTINARENGAKITEEAALAIGALFRDCNEWPIKSESELIHPS